MSPAALGLTSAEAVFGLKTRASLSTSSPSSPGYRADAAEETLITGARAGSSQAFCRLVERHQQGIRAFLRRLSGDPVLADDLAQETFLAAWTQLARFDGRSSLRSWLCGIAYRKHLNNRRGVRRGRQREMDWAEVQRATPSAAVHPDDRIALSTALAELPTDQRAAVALCLANDFSHAEAAIVLGLPLGTVKSHVNRGRAKVLERLGARHD